MITLIETRQGKKYAEDALTNLSINHLRKQIFLSRRLHKKSRIVSDAAFFIEELKMKN
jgi:hypothetical protein